MVRLLVSVQVFPTTDESTAEPTPVITGIYGAVEADKVIHSINMEEGAVTIVKPRAITLINEITSANTFRFLTILAAQSWTRARSKSVV